MNFRQFLTLCVFLPILAGFAAGVWFFVMEMGR